ncbi:MAG: hypothetical protein M1839_006175 [Geoglossum umbratile]|nr:MAG: hypothetical protein M1839_006175 [Geoglossum umbratile]
MAEPSSNVVSMNTNSANVDPMDVKSTNISTGVAPTNVFSSVVESTNTAPSNVVSMDTNSTNVDPMNVEPTNISTDVTPTNVFSSVIESTNTAPSNVAETMVTVAQPSTANGAPLPERSSTSLRQEINVVANEALRRFKGRKTVPQKAPRTGKSSRGGKKRPVPVKKTRAKVPKSTTGRIRRPNKETKYKLKKSTKQYSSNSTRCKALREIRKFQRSTDLLIPKSPFMKLVREVMNDVQGGFPNVTRIQAAALGAIQEAAEAFLVTEFENVNLCAIHARRVTIQSKDWILVKRLRFNMTGREVPSA